MTRPRSSERRAVALAGIIILQTLCALFFLGDVFADFRSLGPGEDLHLGLETVAAIALIAGVAVLLVELRGLLRRMQDMETGLQLARGQMADVVENFFDDWHLTAAERDVALMILKGLDNETIARLRNTAPGTVRAQATRIYSKSGTQGRSQFVSLFVEELMSGEFAGAGTAPSES